MLINFRNALMSGKRLPYDAEVEYLESTGTQWIDTGVVWNRAMTVSATVAGLQSTTFPLQTLFGARDTNEANAGYSFGFNSRNKFVSDNSGSRATSSMSYAQGDVYTVVKNLSGCSITNAAGTTENLVNNARTQTATYNLFLFALNNIGFAIITKSRFYACKIYDANGVLVRDFIPVRKGTVGYLYDRVSGKLFGNAGTGDFVLGQDVVPVEWLESDGNQYIDTGVKPDATYTFDSTVAVMQSNYNCTYWGCRSSGSYQDLNNQCYLASNTSRSSQRIYYYLRLISTNAGDDSNWNSGIIPETGRMYDFSGITTVSTMNAMTYPVVLFGLNIYGTINSASGKVRIAKWTPYKSGVRVNDFRPVRIGTDATSWEGAMMDVLTRRIYRNAGTGAFGYGNDLKYPTPAS